MNAITFIENVSTSYLTDLSLIEQFLAAAPLASYLIIVVVAVKRHYLGKNKNLLLELEEEKDASRRWLKEYNEAASKLQAIEKRLPDSWLNRFKAERAEGNEERAIGFLRDELHCISKIIANASDELALYHVSASPSDTTRHLMEARRYCRLAMLHEGQTPGRQMLLDEIDSHIAGGSASATHSRFHSWDDLHDAFSSQDDSLNSVDILNDAITEKLDRGHYRSALALANRATIIAARSLPPNDLKRLTARHLKSRAFQYLGENQQAIDEIDAYLPTLQNELGPSDGRVQATISLRVRAMGELAMYDEALQKIAEADLAAKSVKLQHQKVQMLLASGKLELALSELEALEQSVANVPPFDMDYAATVALKVRIMNAAHKYSEAQETLNQFSDVLVKKGGDQHPLRGTIEALRKELSGNG